MMGHLKEQLDCEEKADRICDYLEELILDAMLSALDKIVRRTWIIEFPKAQKKQNPQF